MADDTFVFQRIFDIFAPNEPPRDRTPAPDRKPGRHTKQQYKLMKSNKYCVIMAGGVGSRFWPVSRQSRPKQFLDILGTGASFLRQTFERFRPLIPDSNFLVVTNSAYRDLVLEQLPELSPRQVLGEPIGRNTAPCIAYAAFRLNAVDPDAEMVVTPADHYVGDPEEFLRNIGQCLGFVEEHDVLMTVGIRPSRPDTGYGYIQVESSGPISKVKTFTEKPNLELAQAFLRSGEFLWNSGIFIWKVRTILSQIDKHLPDMHQLFAFESRYFNTELEEEAIERIYPECRGISIDFGVMEKADNVYVCDSDFGWSDVGTWGSLYQQLPHDKNGNAVPDCHLLSDTSGCLIQAPAGKMVVACGLKEYIVVDTPDALLICPRSHEQNIKSFIEEMRYMDDNRFL